MNFCVNIWTRGNFLMCMLCTIISLDLTVPLYRYYVLPSLMGDLSSAVSPATIKGHGQSLTLALNVKIKTAKISSEGEMGFL